MIRANRKLKFLSIFEFLCIFFLIISACFANPLSDWNDAKAYKPEPVLFLHGFSSNSATWSSVISEFSQWFSKYQIIGPYLETIDFQNPIGSVDTYTDGSDGWADMLNYRINDLMATNKYGAYTNKLNLICHSMGGLAAREYLTNGKYSSGYADKLILIGTPNLGSPLTNAGKAIVSAYRIGTMWTLPLAVSLFSFRDDIDSVAKLTWIPNFNTSEALEDMTPDSGFLTALNNRFQPSGVEYYGIYGIVGNFLNRFYFGDWYGGDGIVSEKSQLGTGRVSFNKSPRKIEAYHTEEPHLSTLGDNPLLRFLDSAKPEFEITSPNPNETTEIYESSIHIKGKVYKEYLPADSRLIINVERQEDGYKFSPPESYLKPSDLWIPNDPDSPVAEFDEIITFPGKGTYKISCHIKNPAGEVSETKDVWVKVLYEGTNIIVHCHNPEGKEINSIRAAAAVWPPIGLQNVAVIYDGDRIIGYGATIIEAHNRPIAIYPGNHTIKVVFNGMTLQRDIDIPKGETKILTFTFERTEFDIAAWLDTFDDGDNSFETSGEGYIEGPPYKFYEELTKSLSSGSVATSRVDINRLGYYFEGRRDYSYHNRIVQTFNSATFKNEAYAQLTISGEKLPTVSESTVLLDTSGSQLIDLPVHSSFTYWFSQYKENYLYPKIWLVSGNEDYPIIWNRYNYPPYLTGHEVWVIPANINYTSAMWKAVWGGSGAYARASPNTEVEQIYGPYTLTDIKMSSIPYDLEEAGF